MAKSALALTPKHRLAILDTVQCMAAGLAGAPGVPAPRHARGESKAGPGHAARPTQHLVAKSALVPTFPLRHVDLQIVELMENGLLGALGVLAPRLAVGVKRAGPGLVAIPFQNLVAKFALAPTLKHSLVVRKTAKWTAIGQIGALGVPAPRPAAKDKRAGPGHAAHPIQNLVAISALAPTLTHRLVVLGTVALTGTGQTGVPGPPAR